jgi:hypothetical protein
LSHSASPREKTVKGQKSPGSEAHWDHFGGWLSHKASSSKGNIGGNGQDFVAIFNPPEPDCRDLAGTNHRAYGQENHREN